MESRDPDRALLLAMVRRFRPDPSEEEDRKNNPLIRASGKASQCSV